VGGSCKHINESSGSIKGGEILNYLSDYQLLKKAALHEVSELVEIQVLGSKQVLTSAEIYD
jgi:hypothetical protein